MCGSVAGCCITLIEKNRGYLWKNMLAGRTDGFVENKWGIAFKRQSAQERK